MAIVAIIFFIKMLFKSITKISDAIGNSVDNKDNDPLASVRAIITQRYKEREELRNN